MEEMAERAARNTAAEDMYHESDSQFHRAVFEAAHNQALLRMAERLHLHELEQQRGREPAEGAATPAP